MLKGEVFKDGLIVKDRKTIRDANVDVMGDIRISEQGELIIEHAYCNIKGKLYIHDKGKLICRDTVLRFNPTWIFEVVGELYDNSSVELVDTVIDTNFVFPAIVLGGKSQAYLQNVRPETNQTMITPYFGIIDESRLHAVSSQVSGWLGGGGHITAEEHSQVHLELVFSKGMSGELHLVNHPVSELKIPDDRLRGVTWSIELKSGSVGAGWYTDHRAGSDITITGGRGIYVAYMWQDKIKEDVENLLAGFYQDKEFHYNNCRVRLVDTIVSRWTSWVTDGSQIHLRHCDLLDYMIWDKSYSECEDSNINMLGLRNESRAILRNCNLFNPDWGNSMFAKGKSYAELHNCLVESFFPRETEESKISFINCKK